MIQKNDIKVSVVVPVYNVEPYLRRCLDSLVNQTLKNIEIICINDCSPDKSLVILKEYAKKDDRIKIINFNALKDIDEEFREIYKPSKYMDEMRIDKLLFSLKKRIEMLNHFSGNGG